MTDLLRRLHEPKGVGIYVRDIQRAVHGTPAEAAAKARRYGVSWVALLAAWEQIPSNRYDLDDYGAAFRDQGIAVHVWGYPEAGHERLFARHMREGADKAGAVGFLIDPEKPYKGKPVEAAELVAAVLDAMDERHGLGVSSYGLPSAHGDFPWSTFGGYGWGSPQFYSVDPKVAVRGAAHWRALGWTHLVPSLPSFGDDAMGRLLGYLDALERVGPVPGIAVWSWRQIQIAEWRALKEIAGRLRAG